MPPAIVYQTCTSNPYRLLRLGWQAGRLRSQVNYSNREVVSVLPAAFLAVFHKTFQTARHKGASDTLETKQFPDDLRHRNGFNVLAGRCLLFMKKRMQTIRD